MSEDRKTTRPDGAGPDEPADLSEVREARALGQALEGEDSGDSPAVLEALETAAHLAASRPARLSDETLARIGDELFGPVAAAGPPRVRRPVARRAAAGLAAAAAIGLGLFALRSPPARQPEVAAPAGLAPLRGEAEELLAALLPPGGSPAGRADQLAREAAARLQAHSGEGRP